MNKSTKNEVVGLSLARDNKVVDVIKLENDDFFNDLDDILIDLGYENLWSDEYISSDLGFFRDEIDW